MKKFLNLFVLAFVPLLVVAQTTSDAQAKAIADKAVAQLQRTPSRFDFTSTYTAGHDGSKNVSTGVCAISGKKSYVKFGDVETWFDGKTQWVFMPKNNEVSISEPTVAEQSEVNPLLMMRNYSQTHRVGFDEAKDANNYLLCLYPTIAKNAEYFRIKLSIDKKTYQIKRIEFCQRNGDHIVLTVKQQQALPKDFNFTFDKTKHPYVEVNDLR